MQWVIIVPVKDLAHAKSRIGGPWAAHRGSLALAFALDTVSAALAAEGVAAVAVVTEDPLVARETTPLGSVVVGDEPGTGHNPAVVHGALWAHAQHPGAGVAALSGDLPALTPAELECRSRRGSEVRQRLRRRQRGSRNDVADRGAGESVGSGLRGRIR